jgi:hypothetical protein
MRRRGGIEDKTHDGCARVEREGAADKDRESAPV